MAVAGRECVQYPSPLEARAGVPRSGMAARLRAGRRYSCPPVLSMAQRRGCQGTGSGGTVGTIQHKLHVLWGGGRGPSKRQTLRRGTNTCHTNTGRYCSGGKLRTLLVAKAAAPTPPNVFPAAASSCVRAEQLAVHTHAWSRHGCAEVTLVLCLHLACGQSQCIATLEGTYTMGPIALGELLV